MSFTKLFSSITESTVWCENDQVRIVWITMLAMANQNGKVFGSIPGLANRARVPISAVEEALKKFMEPDPYSRTKDFEGRRIEEIDGGWKLLTYEKHSSYRHEDERREYMRDLMRKRRSVSSSVSSVSSPLADVSNVSHGKPPLAHADADADADKEKSNTKSKAGLRPFVPPTLEEISAYCRERNNTVDAEKFLAFYESKGWYVGKNKMTKWKAAVISWEKNNYGGEFRDGYQKTGRAEREQLGTQAQRQLNNARAILAACDVDADRFTDGPRQAPRPSGRDYPVLEGEVKKLP